jgi:hypothetical protein
MEDQTSTGSNSPFGISPWGKKYKTQLVSPHQNSYTRCFDCILPHQASNIFQINFISIKKMVRFDGIILYKLMMILILQWLVYDFWRWGTILIWVCKMVLLFALMAWEPEDFFGEGEVICALPMIIEIRDTYFYSCLRTDTGRYVLAPLRKWFNYLLAWRR